jgi:hypothetical protein
MPEGEYHLTPWLRSVFLFCLSYYLYTVWLCVVWRTLLLSRYVRLCICEKRLGSDRVFSVEFLWEDVWCWEERLLRFRRILWSSECLFCMWLSCLRDHNDASAFFCYCLSPLSCPIFSVFLVGCFSCFVCVTYSLFLSIENSVLGSVYPSVPSRSQLYGFLSVSGNICFSFTPLSY